MIISFISQIQFIASFLIIYNTFFHCHVIDLSWSSDHFSAYFNESAKLRAYAPYPSLIRAYAPYPSLVRTLRTYAPLLTNKRLTRLFLSFFLVKFASNVVASHLYNKIKDLEKNKYSEEPKTTLIRPIFKKNERNKQDKKL